MSAAQREGRGKDCFHSEVCLVREESSPRKRKAEGSIPKQLLHQEAWP